MIIEIPGYEDLRIAGGSHEWQVQSVYKKGKSEGEWYTTNYFPSLEYAVAFVYEKALKETDLEVGYSDVVDECRKVKDALFNAVKRAVSKC